MEDGLKILLNTYWSSNGWKDGTISDNDFQQAKREGYMFDYPKRISHEQTLTKLADVLSKIKPQDVANAFLHSLSSRQLEYRSALGSYWYAVAIPKHSATNEKRCEICEWYAWNTTPDEYEMKHGINVLNFERYKWSGVRHTNLSYALFDLEQFLLLPEMAAKESDIELLIKLLKCMEDLESHNKVGKYRDYLLKKKIIKSNKSEMGSLLDILGICGILSSDNYPCYQLRFADMTRRAPVEHTNDFSFPVNRWQVKDGVNTERFQKVFGMLTQNEYIEQLG